MEYLIIPLLLVIAGLLFYIFTMNRQLNRMSEILDRRVKEQTSQIVSVDMINHHINKLTNCINECLKAEETLRLNSIKEEKMFRELISNISHDIRSPLTSIQGFVTAMLDGTAEPESFERYLRIVSDESARIVKLANEMLDLNSLDEGAVKLSKRSFDINKTIRFVFLGGM